MPGKAKMQKHSAKSIEKKVKAAKARNGGVGGGKDGIDKRMNRKIRLTCHLIGCGVSAPDLKSMRMHFEGSHAKLNWETEKDRYEKMLADSRVPEKKSNK